MKISDLAHYRELLKSLRLQADFNATKNEMDRVLHSVETHRVQMLEHLSRMKNLREAAAKTIAEFDQEIDHLQKDLLDQISALEPSYFSRSYHWYEGPQDHESTDYTLERRFPTTQETQTYIQSRVQAHSGWTHAGLLIRPGREDWIEHMVACDPLYVIDTDHDLLQPAKERFNPIYQRRLRYYAVKEDLNQPILRDLPDGQIGFCLAYNFFHYKPFEIMRAYLREIYLKLKPGGMFCMTFNDCDRPGAVELAERSFTCYTPGRMVLAVLEDTGFVITQNYVLDAAVNWIELRKPGTAASLRGGQALAEIIEKPR